MNDLQAFSDEVFVIVDCAPAVINGFLTIVLDRPLSYIYPDQHTYLYAKDLQYKIMLLPIESITPQVCKIRWKETFKPLGSVIYFGTYGFASVKAVKLQWNLILGKYSDCITSVLNDFDTDFANISLERESDSNPGDLH